MTEIVKLQGKGIKKQIGRMYLKRAREKETGQELSTNSEILHHLPFSVIITSVWELPYLCMCSTASCMLSTTSMQHSSSPYSVRIDFASEGLKVR